MLTSKSELGTAALSILSTTHPLHHLATEYSATSTQLATEYSVLGSSSDFGGFYGIFPSKFLIIPAPLIEKDNLALWLCNSSSEINREATCELVSGQSYFIH